MAGYARETSLDQLRLINGVRGGGGRSWRLAMGCGQGERKGKRCHESRPTTGLSLSLSLCGFMLLKM